MRVFLFLYPIRDYIDHLIDNWLTFSYNGHSVLELNEVINVRYRNEGYQIWWVLFSDPADSRQPDLNRIHEQIDLREQDVIVPCGVDFATHCQLKLYPDFKKLVAQLPPEIERLVIGGYHQWDCVDKTAEAANTAGINVFVDEDLTEHFFPGIGTGNIPKVREDWNLSEILGTSEEIWINIAQDTRKNKPWFTQKP